MQAPMCKLCGEHHYRYEPHRFSDPKTKLMFESEPRWPIEDRLDLPHRYSALADAGRTTNAATNPFPPVAPEDPRSSVQSPSPRTQDTDHRPPATDLSAAQLDPIPDTPDTAPLPEPRKEVMQHQHRQHGPAAKLSDNATAPVTTAGADPISQITDLIMNNQPPAGRPLSLASFDDTALHSLRNLVMNEWMRRERARKRAARKERSSAEQEAMDADRTGNESAGY